MNLEASFDYLIIDEATQLKEDEFTIALQTTGVTHAFFIGYPNKLPPTVVAKVCFQWLF